MKSGHCHNNEAFGRERLQIKAAFSKALLARLLGRLERLLAIICVRSVSFWRMMSKCLNSNSCLWFIAFNSIKIFGSFCFLVEKKLFPIKKTGIFCVFRMSERSGVRIRWQYTRARRLFSRDFKIFSNSQTDSARKLLLLCSDKLLFSTSQFMCFLRNLLPTKFEQFFAGFLHDNPN